MVSIENVDSLIPLNCLSPCKGVAVVTTYNNGETTVRCSNHWGGCPNMCRAINREMAIMGWNAGIMCGRVLSER